MPPKHAIITGGSTGIGFSIAKILANNGWRITLIARSTEKLNQATSALNILKTDILTISADVSNQPAITQAINQSITTFGSPALLITSAGIAQPGYFQTLAPAVYQTAMNVNYFGTLYTIQAAAPAMCQTGTGHIVMISSGAALVGVYGYSAYAPSKFAVRGLAEVLRSEFKPNGVNVSIVYPPDTDTPQLAEENKAKPAETFAISKNAATWQPDDVAQIIMKGIKKKQFNITPGFEMSALARLGSLINPLLQFGFDRIIKKVQANKS